MRIYRSLAELPGDFGPCAITIGNFDGVHIGHQQIMRRVCRDGPRTRLEGRGADFRSASQPSWLLRRARRICSPRRNSARG